MQKALHYNSNIKCTKKFPDFCRFMLWMFIAGSKGHCNPGQEFYTGGNCCFFRVTIKGTSINCRECLEYEANGAQKPECTQGT